MQKVLVTGAAGHLGVNLVQELCLRGYSVRAGVRDLRNLPKTHLLRKTDAEIIQVDVLAPEQLSKVMIGCEGIFHLAAVYDVTSKNPELEVKIPAIEGTRNLLSAASQFGVKKVIMTSSVAAVGPSDSIEEIRDENDWNTNAIEPYAQAKMESERLAWGLSKKLGIDLVTILPGLIIGPGFSRHTPSTQIFEMLLRRQVPFILPFTLAFVDVRDVARAHCVAYESKTAEGRYILSCQTASLKEIVKIVQKLRPTLKVPKMMFPKLWMKMLPSLDLISWKLGLAPRLITKKTVSELNGKYQIFSTTRAENELMLNFRNLENSIEDTLNWIEEKFM
jgi:dihydroflavonol-4-reductase